MFEYTYYEDLADSVDIPKAGITSRPLHKSDRLRAVIFAFAEGEEMGEHTAAVATIAQIIEGECTFTLENEVKEMKAGAWVLMDAYLPHRIVSHTPLKLILYLAV
ncbi:cupin domain-containing protein [Shewanella sp. 38A_GOM-205m]|uniref:cupin domain-containing protein n=1 Tax=Shewanella sp. 38A_GOM-205m TaxID=1380363 RepID=UPI00048F8789|nr:cupin domain-containing protein [Shewanella sp. 38A_GOM-205m]